MGAVAKAAGSAAVDPSFICQADSTITVDCKFKL
jgi:hypothetical protein